jgi:hypothetical protein
VARSDLTLFVIAPEARNNVMQPALRVRRTAVNGVSLVRKKRGEHKGDTCKGGVDRVTALEAILDRPHLAVFGIVKLSG